MYTADDVEDTLNTPPSPCDGPGKLYGLEVTHPDGTVVLKVGRSIDPVHRAKEWECQCWKDEIVLLWTIPTKYASKLGGCLNDNDAAHSSRFRARLSPIFQGQTRLDDPDSVQVLLAQTPRKILG
jgi:hypothetical protein